MFQTKNPNYKTSVRDLLKGQAFMQLMGFQIDTIELGVVKGSVPLKKELLQQDGIMHGGAIATVADIVAGFAIYTLIPQGQRVVTTEIKVSYFRAADGDQIEAVGKVIKAGAQFSFAEAEVFAISGEKKVLVAKATTTMAILK